DPSVHGWVPDATMWAVGRLRLHGWRHTANFIEDVLLTAPHARWTHWRQVRHAKKHIIEGSADIVVMGHSHIAARLAIGSGMYVNSGALESRRLSYASIDTEARTVVIHHIR